MKLAVPMLIANCAECRRSFTWREFSELPDAGDEQIHGVIITRRTCSCGHVVRVRRFEEMDPCLLWMSWEQHQQMYPNTLRRPQRIPETRADRVELWIRRHSFAALLVALALVFAAIAMGVRLWS